MTLKEKFKHYFIWEKSNLSKGGVSIKFKVNRYCYIKPTSCCSWDNLFRKEWFDKPMISCWVCSSKVYYWLWFRLVVKTEYKPVNKIIENDLIFNKDYYL